MFGQAPTARRGMREAAEGKNKASRPAPAPRAAGTQSSRSCSGSRGLTLADSWDVRVATFSCEDSSSRRSLRICCGERAEGVRGARRSPAPRRQGQATSRGHGLTSDCIFSSAWQRESRERQTDRGRQSGRQRDTDRLGARQKHAQSPPRSHPALPAMHEAVQRRGGSYGGIGGGRARGQGQHRSVNCNRTKCSASGRPWPAASPGAVGCRV